jgi:hypothetical protein
LGGPAAEDDFDVMDDGRRIGRIYFQPGSLEPWRWSISQALAADKRGRAESRVNALEALTDAYAQSRDGSGAPAESPKPRHTVRNLLAAQ